MDNDDKQFSEEDIQTAMRYLQTKDPEKATREDAIELLKKMGDTAHLIAEMSAEDESHSD
jgi:HEAT repeat protein